MEEIKELKNSIQNCQKVMDVCNLTGNMDCYTEHSNLHKWLEELLFIKTSGLQEIVNERKRQIESEGFDAYHDQIFNERGELAVVASCYALPDEHRTNCLWPEDWDLKWFKPTPEDRIRELSKAGALISAEINRLQNKNKD